MFTVALEREWRFDNSAKGFHHRIEHAHECFLLHEDLTQLAAVLDCTAPFLPEGPPQRTGNPRSEMGCDFHFG